MGALRIESGDPMLNVPRDEAARNIQKTGFSCSGHSGPSAALPPLALAHLALLSLQSPSPCLLALHPSRRQVCPVC